MTLGKRICLGAFVTVGVGIGSCCLMGWLVCTEVVTVEAGSLLAGLLSVAVLFGVCYRVARTTSRSRLPAAMLTALAVTLLRGVGKGIFFSEHPLYLDWRIAVSFAAAALAGVLASRQKARRR